MTTDTSAAATTLTTRQQRIYRFIRDWMEKHGYSPSIREIGQKFGISSPNGVQAHLRALARKGYIMRASSKPRTIVLTDAAKAEEAGLPVHGRVKAGALHEAVAENGESIDINSLFKRSGSFLLRVEGDSMIDAHIADGDLVVIQPGKSAKSGDMAVVQTEEGDATLKGWYPEKNRIRLQPANKRLKPIFVKKAKVLGVVVGVVRKY